MTTRLRPPTVAAVVGGAAALWGLAIGLGQLSDNSALTHLATGHLILDDGIPRHDPFSFTAAGKPWVVYSWLASAGMALADDLGGGHGIQVARAVFTTALAVLAWRLSRPAHALIGRILTTTVVLAVGTATWTERPLLPALALFATLIWLVEEERGSRWVIAAMFWVWVNVHGSFPLGLVYLAVRLAGRRLDRMPASHLSGVLGAAALGTLAGALNPLGPRLLVFPFQLLGRRELLERVQEWQPPVLSDPVNLAYFVAVGAALLLAGRRRSWEDVAPIAVFTLAACLARRNLPAASVVLAPGLARGLRGLGSVSGDRRGGPVSLAAGALLAVAVVLGATALDRPAYDLEGYPVASIDWMDDRGLLDRRVATQDFVGNYLIALRGTDGRVFFDDRFDMYPPQVIRDQLTLLDGGERWRERLDHYRIEVVLWERGKAMASLLAADHEWRVVRRDARWMVAVRADAGG